MDAFDRRSGPDRLHENIAALILVAFDDKPEVREQNQAVVLNIGTSIAPPFVLPGPVVVSVAVAVAVLSGAGW